MPIVFEEISSEIAPPPAGGATPGASSEASGSGEDLTATLQAQLALQHERQARLRAD